MNTTGLVFGIILIIAGLIGLFVVYHLLAIQFDLPRLIDWSFNSDKDD